MISDADLRDRLASVGATQENPPPTRGAAQAARRGTPEFASMLKEVEDLYVTADYPGLASYAYQADLIGVVEGEDIMGEILEDLAELSVEPGQDAMFRTKGESRWRSFVDSNDFPQPSTDALDDEGGEGEGETEDCGCYEDCSCPEDPCGCDPCPCGDGCVCCCECLEEDEGEEE